MLHIFTFLFIVDESSLHHMLLCKYYLYYGIEGSVVSFLTLLWNFLLSLNVQSLFNESK